MQARVRDLLRASAGLDQATKNLVDIYQDIIEEHQRRSPDLAEERIWQCLLWQRLSLKLTKAWVRLPPSQKVFIRKLPGSVIVREKAKNLLQK